MSHHKERAEKVCLNCGTQPLTDLYCPHCGQENVEPKHTLWHLIVHFFNDVTHFDGKFFSTMKLLVFRPGYLSAEYISGHRVKYLDPIRMYLFISAMFFLVAYASCNQKDYVGMHDKAAQHFMDSVRAEQRSVDGFNFTIINEPSVSDKRMSLFDVPDEMEHGMTYYDSVQKSKPVDERPNFVDHFIRRKLAGVYQTYNENPYNFVPNAVNAFIKSFSKIFFISLPLFAIYLSILYLRRRKQWYFVSHAIFSIHYYCVIFLFLAILFGLMAIPPITTEFLYYTAMTIAGILLVYLLIAMKRYYQQDWIRTAIKFLLLASATTLTLWILIIIMFINALATTH